MTYSKEDADRDALIAQQSAELLRGIRAGQLDPRNAARELTGEYDQDFITGVLELAARAGAMWEPDWGISLDGDHKINDHRRWMAKCLMDSKFDDTEAYGCVAFHPCITDRNKKLSSRRTVLESDEELAAQAREIYCQWSVGNHVPWKDAPEDAKATWLKVAALLRGQP